MRVKAWAVRDKNIPKIACVYISVPVFGVGEYCPNDNDDGEFISLPGDFGLRPGEKREVWIVTEDELKGGEDADE